MDIDILDLEKNLNRSIEIDKKEKEIKIEEEIIRYAVFSVVAYFYSHSAWHGVLLRIDRPLRCIYLK